MEWQQFLEHLTHHGHTVLATHLQSCELASCSATGLVELACCRKFSCEEVQQERDMLQQEMVRFYQQPLQLRIRYDAAKDACTKEKSRFTLFQELSQQNEVIRFIVQEFGGELMY